jgi:hypothetical protein
MQCMLLRAFREATFFDETAFRALRDILDNPRGLHSFAFCYRQLGSQEIVKRHNRQRSAIFAIGDNDDTILRLDQQVLDFANRLPFMIPMAIAMPLVISTNCAKLSIG